MGLSSPIMAIQAVELLYDTAPGHDFSALGRRVAALRGGEIETQVLQPGANALIFHKDKVVGYDDGQAPAQTTVFTTALAEAQRDYEADVQQSWACETAAVLTQGVTHASLIAEMMARALPPAERLALFHAVLQAAIETTPPKALVFKQSQQVVAPADYLAAVSEPPIRRPGSLNVRFFNIADTPGDMIMDTRGLEEIGLHDLQCQFRDLDPNEVGRLLYNLAFYVFENGAVIESGHTVAGIQADSRWRCRFEPSLLEPKRDLLDVDPGAPHAAGRRDEA